MPGIKCPKCGKTGHSFWEGFLRPTYSSVKCPFCEVRLELLNAGRCHFISGIIFAAILVFLFVMQLPLMWAWVILSGFLCWFLDVFIVWLFGRWWVWSYEISESAKLRWLSAANTVSTIIVGIWVFYMAWMLLLPYWKMVADFDLLDERIDEMIEHYKKLFSVQGIIGIIIGILSVATSGTTGLIKGKLRRRAVERSLSQD